MVYAEIYSFAPFRSAVHASLTEKSNMLVFKVSDNGIGITKSKKMEPESLGLLNIWERARTLNGKSQINGMPDKGTTVTVTIPLDIPAAAQNQ